MILPLKLPYHLHNSFYSANFYSLISETQAQSLLPRKAGTMESECDMLLLQCLQARIRFKEVSRWLVADQCNVSWKLDLSENKNTLTGPANCKKITRHHAYLSLCAKSRKTNYAKSRKWPKTSIWAIFWRLRDQISPNCKFFWKARFIQIEGLFSTNFRPKSKKIVRAIFEENIKVSDFGLLWRPFCEYLQIKNFFQKSGSVTFLPIYSLISGKKSEKSLEPLLRKLRYQPTNQSIITNNTDLIGPRWRHSKKQYLK